MIMNLFRYS